MNVTEKLKFVMERIKNTVRKGENAGDQYSLLFSQCLENCSTTSSLSLVCVVKGYSMIFVIWLTVFSPFLTMYPLADIIGR